MKRRYTLTVTDPAEAQELEIAVKATDLWLVIQDFLEYYRTQLDAEASDDLEAAHRELLELLDERG